MYFIQPVQLPQLLLHLLHSAVRQLFPGNELDFHGQRIPVDGRFLDQYLH